MRELTSRQREILAFIRTFSQRHGVSPTVREIGERFRVTPRAAFDHLKALERKGALQRRPSARRTSRALTLPDRGATVREVPVLGRIAAGQPLLAEENREGSIPILAEWLAGKGRELFALRVRGESMVSAHIVDGDLVLVRPQETAEPGEIVVALLDNEATVKRFGRQGEAIVLKPEHPTMAPIAVKPGERDVKILGKVVGLLRGF
ncbi:MAG: transcriptional repressor LexA [Candidatus Methylomirabilia bacterium]